MTWTADPPNATKTLVDFRKLNIHAGAGHSVVLRLLWQLVAPTCDVNCAMLSQQQLGRLDETMCTNNNGAVNVVIAGVPCMCVQCTWIAGCPEVLALQLWCCCCWEETTMSGTMTNR